jgi:hypothetical protein
MSQEIDRASLSVWVVDVDFAPHRQHFT